MVASFGSPACRATDEQELAGLAKLTRRLNFIHSDQWTIQWCMMICLGSKSQPIDLLAIKYGSTHRHPPRISSTSCIIPEHPKV
ncbi:hypothetical protein PGTUg99_008669 [Puccinia graminis f. sp. tritici]|uniref:Uncharacterized protein n=1 Tax=Puccinia graminis f. sp. tritici TaxID=56615 RepID=A0A5B0RF18_PUCGR|nr:hypothetical protein PGTUg99_008669 [Puccinia graminis f. sp. tritici]